MPLEQHQPNWARVERGGTPKPQRCRSETPLHPRGFLDILLGGDRAAFYRRPPFNATRSREI